MALAVVTQTGSKPPTRRSPHGTLAPVDPDITWRKSSRCGNTTCVEVASVDGVDGAVYLRDSKNPDQPAMRFTHAEWSAFLECVTAGDFK